MALQRKMFEEYERRERARKVAELQEVVPGLAQEEAEKALELCDGRCAALPGSHSPAVQLCSTTIPRNCAA